MHGKFIEHPELYADSTKFMSWEQYFTKLLIEATKFTEYMKYSKDRLPDYYLQDKQVLAIKTIIKGIKF